MAVFGDSDEPGFLSGIATFATRNRDEQPYATSTQIGSIRPGELEAYRESGELPGPFPNTDPPEPDEQGAIDPDDLDSQPVLPLSVEGVEGANTGGNSLFGGLGGKLRGLALLAIGLVAAYTLGQLFTFNFMVGDEQ